VKTKVKFRIDHSGEFKGIVTAVFPDEIFDMRGNLTCYAHVGQHGACSEQWVKEQTNEATFEEYMDLKKELESIVGYNLEVIK